MSDATLKMVFTWADKIIVAQPELAGRVPEPFKGKVLVWDVGPDEGRYGHALNADLQSKAAQFAARDGI